MHQEMDDELYRDIIMDHFRNPRNCDSINNPDFSSGQVNPSCGDKISISGCVCNGKVSKLCFDGIGCVINQATASMLTELCIGKTAEEILNMNSQDITNLIRIHLGPVRMKCALLSLQALQKGIVQFKEKTGRRRE